MSATFPAGIPGNECTHLVTAVTGTGWVTLCGRDGQAMSRRSVFGDDRQAFLFRACRTCKRRKDAASAMPAHVAAAILANPAVTDVRVVTDALAVLTYDAGSVTAVSHDDTGDALAEWRGCVVGVRFTFADDARTFLAGDRSVRPSSCRMEFGGYGACIRQASHGGQCADAHGHRFHGARRTTMDEYLTMRADAMERHPAGKGRTLRDHRADSDRAADGSERPPASVLLAFTRRGYTVRRATRAHRGWVIMAFRPLGLKDNGTYRYVVASIMEGDAEWTNGHYSLSPMAADRAFAERAR